MASIACWINQPAQIWTIGLDLAGWSSPEPHYLTFSKPRRGRLSGDTSEVVVRPFHLVTLFSRWTLVEPRERSVPRKSGWGQHRGGLCPPSLSTNYSPVKIVFLPWRRRVNGPRSWVWGATLSAHTNMGSGVNRAPLMWLDEIPAIFSRPRGDKSLCRMWYN